MKTISFLLFLFCTKYSGNSTLQDLAVEISYTTSVNPLDRSLVYYSANRPLTITDFKGTPVSAGEAVAITSSGFAFKAGFKNLAGKATLNILVYCSFDKNRSWMKEKGRNAYILKHEQQHFNISYIGTLRFIKKMKAIKFTTTNYSKQIENTYRDAVEQMEIMQNKYDGETSNGRLTDKQAAWEARIAAELEQLEKD
jgi:hypothetical protein